MTRSKVCTECGGTMQVGFIPRVYGFSNPIGVTYWLEGKPEIGFWGLKTKDKQSFHIIDYRCESCGFLKFYAGPDNSKKDK